MPAAGTRPVTTAVVAVLIGALVALLAGPAPPRLSDSTSGDRELAEQVRDLLGDGQGYRGVAVALVEGGQVRFAGLGSSGHDGVPTVDEHTRFEIGSIGKALNGMLLADLVETGAVRLDQRVGDLVPGTALEQSGAATLAELAGHRSGLPRVPLQPGFLARSTLANVTAGNPYRGTTEQDILNWAGAAAPAGNAEPAYSNFGAAVLGLALAGDRDYPALLTERVLAPLDMADTTISVDPSTLPEPRAVGVSRSGRSQAPWIAPGFVPAGIGVWSTTGDLAQLAQKVLDGDAPGIAAIEPRWDFAEGERIGLGWFISDVHGRTITWHNGGTGGFRSFVGLDLEADRAVVMLSNSGAPLDGAAFDLLTREAL